MARKSTTSKRQSRGTPVRDARRTGRTVKETDATVPVKPVRRSSEARRPMPTPALDHRREIVGTDELKGEPRRRK
jgi:hypothetical protein